MTLDREPDGNGAGQGRPSGDRATPPRTWVLPLVFLTVLAVPVLILVLSNTDSQEIGFAGWVWEAPLWIILTITFAAGSLLTRLFGWVWGAIRRRGLKRKMSFLETRRERKS
jgi:uncharacterized integral membrane protein